ncbi:membrane protein [Phytophthora palmivora]|uniref:Membrane protein n=1 Tax=Phytophthora palmivora TaxID=4796 RepID=A0A2P4Y1L4_9STRA|nr:membrane protein [Phytophthora palmivora]
MLGASLVGAVRRATALRSLPLAASGLPASTLPMARIERLRFFMQQSPQARSPSFLAVSRSSGVSGLHRFSSSVSKASTEEATANMSHLERLKDLWRKYGVVAIGTYLTMYGVVLGSMYLAIDQGWVHTTKRTNSKGEGQSDDSFNLVTTTNKFVKIAEDLGIAQYLEVERVNSKTGTFLLAWIATKFTEPVRLAVTIAITPRIARFLGRAPKLPPKAPGKLASMIKKQQAAKEQPKA